MAEKEERILIDVINPGINCVYRLDNDPKGQSLCKHNGNMEPVTAKECRHCEEGRSRQDTIGKIAKALCKFEMMTERHLCKECSEECFEHLELEVVGKAEAVLDALLEKE